MIRLKLLEGSFNLASSSSVARVGVPSSWYNVSYSAFPPLGVSSTAAPAAQGSAFAIPPSSPLKNPPPVAAPPAAPAAGAAVLPRLGRLPNPLIVFRLATISAIFSAIPAPLPTSQKAASASMPFSTASTLPSSVNHFSRSLSVVSTWPITCTTPFSLPCSSSPTLPMLSAAALIASPSRVKKSVRFFSRSAIA